MFTSRRDEPEAACWVPGLRYTVETQCEDCAAHEEEAGACLQTLGWSAWHKRILTNAQRQMVQQRRTAWWLVQRLNLPMDRAQEAMQSAW